MTRKYLVMNFIFIDVVVAGAICGHFCYKYHGELSMLWAIVTGGLLVGIAMFIGMILAFMAADDREHDKRVRAELNFQKQMQQVVLNERCSCAKVAVNMAKAMTDRVVNTIISKYVDGLSDDAKRRRVLEGANAVVISEVQSLTKALFDELRTEKKG